MDLDQYNDKVEWIKTAAKKVGLLSFIFGFTLSLIFQPYFNARLTHEFHEHRAPGYEKHDLNFEMEIIDMERYEDGDRIPGYDGLIWDSDYSIYRVSVINQEPIPFTNFRMDIPFPGCVVHTETDEPYGRGDYNVRNTVDVRIRSSNETSLRKLGCTKRISTSQLAPSEEIVAEFVVTNSFNRCDFLLGYTPAFREAKGNINVEYYWQKRGVFLKESHNAGNYKDDYKYQSPSDSIYPAAFDVREGILDSSYPVMIAGVNESSIQSAASKCS